MPLSIVPIADINAIIPLHFYSSKHYIPFWLLTLSKFLLFLTHNMITALATTLFGHNGSLAMSILYIFFILGNFIAPKLLSLCGNQSSKLMFFTSLIYTIFAATTTLVVMTMHSDTFPVSLDTIHNCFYISSAIVGLAGGAIWVSYGVLNISMGDSISQAIFNDYREIEPLNDTHYSDEELLFSLNEAITAKIMSIGWSLLSLNTVVGGFLTFIVLTPTGSESSLNPQRLTLLFIIFTLISCMANVSYFILYSFQTEKYTPSDSIDKNEYLDHAQESAEKHNLLSPSPQYGSISLPYDINNESDDDENDDEEAQYDNNCHYHQDSSKINPNMSQWELFSDIIFTPYILLSIPQYIAAGMTFNFLFSSFTAYTVAPLLGTENVAVVVIVAYITSTIASFFVGDWITTHFKARKWSIIGTLIQLFTPLLPLAVPLFLVGATPLEGEPIVPKTTYIDAWCFSILIAICAGAGDAIMSSSLTTCMSIDIKQDPSLGGCRYSTVSEKITGDIKSIVYSIYSSVKSIGVFLVFFLSGFTSYHQQSMITCGIVLASLISQYALYSRLSNEVYPGSEEGKYFSQNINNQF